MPTKRKPPHKPRGIVVLDPGSTVEETYVADEVGLAGVSDIAIVDAHNVQIKSGQNTWRIEVAEDGSLGILLSSFNSQILIAPHVSNNLTLRPSPA